MHIPEKWFPGCLDYYLNSHNIMHVLVVLAVYSMHQVNCLIITLNFHTSCTMLLNSLKATVSDLEWMHSMSSSNCGSAINQTIDIPFLSNLTSESHLEL